MDAWIDARDYTCWASILTLSYNHSPNTKVCKVSKEENHVDVKE